MESTPSPLPLLPSRAADSHKGSYGRVLIIGGSRGMSGAAALAGMAALRSGAGLVRLAVAESCLDTVAAFDPCYMTVPLPDDSEGRLAVDSVADLEPILDWATTVAIGPGLSRSAQLDHLVVELYRHAVQPLVVDADALNALASQGIDLSKHAAPRILTPHPGEMARLIDSNIDQVQAARKDVAQAFAKAHDVILVLKGHATVIASRDQLAINATGNPGMATGGTGDVLTGITVAITAQGLAPFDAARLAAHVHGLAGDLQAARLGEVSLIARDLIDGLPQAFQSFAPAATSRR